MSAAHFDDVRFPSKPSRIRLIIARCRSLSPVSRCVSQKRVSASEIAIGGGEEIPTKTRARNRDSRSSPENLEPVLAGFRRAGERQMP